MIKMRTHRRSQRMPVRWYVTARARHGQRYGATSCCWLHSSSMQLQWGLFSLPLPSSAAIHVNLSLQPLAAHRRTGSRTMSNLATVNTTTTSAIVATAVAVRTIRVLWRTLAKVEIRMLTAVITPLLIRCLDTTRALFDLWLRQFKKSRDYYSKIYWTPYRSHRYNREQTNRNMDKQTINVNKATTHRFHSRLNGWISLQFKAD